MSLIGICIVNYNTSELVSELLTSIKQNIKIKVRISIISNGSLESYINLDKSLQEESCDIQHNFSENRGLGSGLNLAASFIRDSDILWFLNSDLEIKDGSIEALLRVARMHDKFMLGSVSETLDRMDYGLKQDKFTGLFRMSDTFERNLLPYGSALFIDSVSFYEVGCFDENFFLYYEELDLAYRLVRKAIHIEVVADSHLRHLQGESTGVKRNRKRNTRMRYLMYKSGLRFFFKHEKPRIVVYMLFIIYSELKEALRG